LSEPVISEKQRRNSDHRASGSPRFWRATKTLTKSAIISLTEEGGAMQRATAWTIVLVLILAGLAAYGFEAHRTSATPPAAGGPPLKVVTVSARAMVATACGTACPASLPAVAAGYEPLAAFGPNSPSGVVDFVSRPLEVCFAVGSLSLGKLSFEIGSPVGGPMTLFDDVDPDMTAMQGCLLDPGNDSGPHQVTTAASYPGSWVVRIDQQD
jgi:hypothetical protein